MQESESNQTQLPPASTNSKFKEEDSQISQKPNLSIWRRMFRILLIGLIVFGLGALIVIFTLYIPIREKLFSAETRIDELTIHSETELVEANQEIERLSSIEDRYSDTQVELETLSFDNLILSIRVDLLSAKLALLSEETEQASQALKETPGKIDHLGKWVDDQQQKNIENLQTRLDLVLAELKEETFAAISDLEVMLDILDDLES